MKHEVRLSQCMIVKNEEKNIRKALSWGKDIVFEQIVVDTGSSDRTIEIAEEMGAKVYHFTWNNDFSAAKNYAIEQAAGNWIAFLDADEYFDSDDASKLAAMLRKIEKNCNVKTKPHILRAKMINLDDEGRPFSVFVQDRIFRNVKTLRYNGRIHEQLKMPGGRKPGLLDCQDELTIFHTGYSRETYAETKKTSRNIEMLRLELEADPKNYNIMSYLGDSLLTEGCITEARTYFETVIGQKPISENLTEERYHNAGLNLLKILSADRKNVDSKKLYNVAKKLNYPDNENPDVHYYLGVYFIYTNQYEQAKFELESGLHKTEQYRGTGNVMMLGDLENVYIWLAGACQNLNLPQETVKYTVLGLRMNKYRSDALYVLLSMLKKEPGEEASATGTLGFLGKMYDFYNSRDLAFLIHGARQTSFMALIQKLTAVSSENESAASYGNSDSNGD